MKCRKHILRGSGGNYIFMQHWFNDDINEWVEINDEDIVMLKNKHMVKGGDNMTKYLKGTVNALYFCYLEHGIGSEEFAQQLLRVFGEMDDNHKRTIQTKWLELWRPKPIGRVE